MVEDTLKMIVDALLPAFQIVLLGVGIALGRAVHRWLGTKGDVDKLVKEAEVDAFIERAVVRGVDRADQWASTAESPSSHEKLQTALDYVQKELATHNVAEMGRDWLVELIEAELGRRRRTGDR
jgi:hypothetical protein